MTAAPQLKLVPKDTNHDIDKLIEETAAGVEGSRFALAVREKGGVDYVPPSGPMRFNDIANAERFLTEFGNNILYCVEAAEWMVYSGVYWQHDDVFFVMDYAREWVKAELEAALPEGDKARIKNADRLNHDPGYNAMLKQARYQRAVKLDLFDSKSTDRLFNCANGTIDLSTGTLRSHDRRDFITRSTPFRFEGLDAKCPEFERFFAEIQPDEDVRNFLQRSIGYSLLGSVDEHAFWILLGNGNNGKSVFTNLLLDMFGQYGSGMSAESLMDVKKSGSAPNSDIARLKGKRYVLVQESNENERLNTAQIKALSAGDVVTARHLFKDFFDFAFTGKLWIATNHKPVITDISKGLWRRLKLVKFPLDVSDDKLIKPNELHQRFMKEAPGILAWAVRGCLEYLSEKSLGVPAVVQADIDEYKFEQDSIAQFLANACQTWEQFVAIRATSGAYATEADFQVDNSELYEAYVKYCKSTGTYQRGQQRFTVNMKERGFVQRNSGGRYWENLRLLSK